MHERTVPAIASYSLIIKIRLKIVHLRVDLDAEINPLSVIDLT